MPINLSSKVAFINEKFLFFKNEDGLFFPFFRIAISIFCLIHLLSIIPDFELLYTSNGLIPPNVLSILKTDYMPSYNFIQNTLVHLGISASSFAIGYMVLYCLLCVLLGIGLFSRISSILLLLLHVLIFQSASPYMYGVEYFKTISLFYCVVFPVGCKMSFDQKIFKWNEINPSPYRNLLKIHLAVVYFTSGIDKAFGINWWNGESIWKAIHLPGFKSHFVNSYSILTHYPVLPIVFGIATMIIEVFYPLAMSIKKSRFAWLMLTVSLHVGIIIFMNLYFFGILMILLNFSAFMKLEENKKNV